LNKDTIYLLCDLASKLSILKNKIKNSLGDKDYTEAREMINDCQEMMAVHCDCAPIKLISGSIKKDIDDDQVT
jgi:hypothetical protein